MDVGTERLERRHVDDPGLVGKRALESLAEQLIERVQESRQGLARSRWRCNESVPARPNRFPAEALGRGGFAKTVLKPAGDNRMERGQRHRRNISQWLGLGPFLRVGAEPFWWGLVKLPRWDYIITKWSG